MIKYSLQCSNGHSFESWFQNSAAFDKLKAGKLLQCEICGSPDVSKGIMAPNITPSTKSSRGMTEAEAMTYIKNNYKDVGDKFAATAKSMHEGDTPQNAIYGIATTDECKELIEEGIPFVPLGPVVQSN